MDEDFTERMFARQIATMKGQAWNVVETLKTPSHGPLELTRRARVCVWDDLVDVPVVREMRSASSELRRKTAPDGLVPTRTSQENEEMDIGIMADIPAPGLSKTTDGDLLGLDSPRRDLPNPNRFELSPRGGTPADEASGFMFGGIDDHAETSARPHRNTLTSEPDSDFGARKSNDELMPGPSTRRGSGSGKPRRPSVTARYGSFLYDPAEDEGDLGYGKAATTEGNTRKVIVERLETVKSKNPVFTWC